MEQETPAFNFEQGVEEVNVIEERDFSAVQEI